jgi:hypothetical protein
MVIASSECVTTAMLAGYTRRCKRFQFFPKCFIAQRLEVTASALRILIPTRPSKRKNGMEVVSHPNFASRI